jgi:hypothetical protein
MGSLIFIAVLYFAGSVFFARFLKRVLEWDFYWNNVEGFCLCLFWPVSLLIIILYLSVCFILPLKATKLFIRALKAIASGFWSMTFGWAIKDVEK